MKYRNPRSPILIAALLASVVFAAPARAGVEPLQSPRMERAKNFITDEQWDRAIEQLKAAVADAKERHKDEALYWLAYSQHQGQDLAAAVQTISRLEQQHPKSFWVKPARSLRIEIAQKLQRKDVLWWTAVPPAPPAAAAPPSPHAATAAPAPAPPTPGATPAPPPPPRRGLTSRRAPALPAGTPPAPTPGAAPATEPPALPEPTTTVKDVPGPRPRPDPFAFNAFKGPMPSSMWIPDGWSPDMSLRIQALGSLMQTDATRVIPILREIALESPDANEASRAVFVLAKSGRADARSTVVEVAKRGSETVQIAAVRELGRFGGPKAAEELLQVYVSSNPRVKNQVLLSLGERSATSALMRIAETERNVRLQETAIVRLGQTGASEHLGRLYNRASPNLRRSIIVGLFMARAEDELIRIADRERHEPLRAEVLTHLRLLGTQKARAYVEKQSKNR